MKLSVRFWLSLLLLLPCPAGGNPIIADISNYRIDIDSHYIGTKLFLFGTRNASGDVVVVIRGPEREYTVRRKERLAGVWVNRRSVSFAQLPDFYALASSRPLDEIENPYLERMLRIGKDQLFTVTSASSRKLNVEEFENAFLAQKQSERLYNLPGTLQFMGDSLFKATFEFPDTIVKGRYTAEIYLMQDDRLLGMQALPIEVRPVGLDATLYDFAHEYALAYGITAIALALAAGWIANHVFRRL